MAAIACHQLGNKATRDHSGGARHLQEFGRGLGASHPIRTGDDRHGRRPRPSGAQDLDREPRRLDRPDRGGRTALRQAGAAAGRRAQRRDHPVGLGRPQRPTCTTRSRPTSASRPSMPMASTSARRKRARIGSRCSIRQHQSAPPWSRCRCATPTWSRRRTTPWRRRPIGATRRSGTARPACTA